MNWKVTLPLSCRPYSAHAFILKRASDCIPSCQPTAADSSRRLMELTAIVLWAQRTSAYKEREQEWGCSPPRGGAAGPEQPASETQKLELGWRVVVVTDVRKGLWPAEADMQGQSTVSWRCGESAA